MIEARDWIAAATLGIKKKLAELDALNQNVLTNAALEPKGILSAEWYERDDLFTFNLEELNKVLQDKPITDSKRFRRYLLEIMQKRMSNISCVRCGMWTREVDAQAERLLQALKESR